MLYDKLKKYYQSNVYPFHMPGHKRQSIIDNLPYQLDLTEIDGFDNLHNPESCIKAVEDKAAMLYNAKRAFMLVNGATCGIMSSIGALTNRGDSVLVARNCHISVYRAINLFGLKPEYILPEYICENNMTYTIFASVNPEIVEQKLSQNPSIKLLIITSPTYEGVTSDIKSISKICKAHNVRLLVDEAHGAHFPFSDYFPKSAIDCGADISVVSLHKTLPALTQTALLLTNDFGLQSNLRKELAIFQTSSPSYALMSSVDVCLDYTAENKRAFEEYVVRLEQFEKRSKNLKNIRLILREKLKNVFDYDKGKLIISTAACNLSGTELARIIRSEYHIEIEMASLDFILAMTSVCDTDNGFDLLFFALSEIDKLCDKQNIKKPVFIKELPKKALEPYECNTIKGQLSDINECADKTSLDNIFAYPPGIPIVAAGEIITKDSVNLINSMKKSGISVYPDSKIKIMS